MIPPVLAASAASAGVATVAALASRLSSDEASSSSAAANGAATSASGPVKRNDALGQTEFLSLLVAQLQNQDPLSPMDSADFSAQLAQFTSLEQLMQINQKLDALGEDDPVKAPAFDPVGLLGRDVAANGSAVRVAGGDASALEYTLASAGKVTVEVKSSNGTVVGKAELGATGAGTHTLDLDDVAQLENLADGAYTVSVQAQSGDAPAVTVRTRITGTVTGVDLTTDPPTIRVGDLEIPLGDVREVRAPAASA